MTSPSDQGRPDDQGEQLILSSPARASTMPSTGERVVAVVLLLLYLLECSVVGFYGTLFGMLSDGCGGVERCNYVLLNAGISVASLGQIVPAGAAVLWFCLRLRRARSAWFVPLVMAPVPPLLLYIGVSIAAAGVP